MNGYWRRRLHTWFIGENFCIAPKCGRTTRDLGQHLWYCEQHGFDTFETDDEFQVRMDNGEPDDLDLMMMTTQSVSQEPRPDWLEMDALAFGRTREHYDSGSR